MLVAVDQQATRRQVSLELSVEFAVIQVTQFREAVEAIQQHSLAAIVCNYGFAGQANPLELFHFARTRVANTPRVILADPVSALEAHQAITTEVANVFVGDAASGGTVLAALRKLRRAQSADDAERRAAPRWPTSTLRARVDSTSFFNAAGSVVNLSRGGVLIDLEDSTIAIGERLHVTLCLSNWLPVRLPCSVLRVNRGGRRATVAARFDQLDGAGLNALSVALDAAQRQNNMNVT